MILIVTNKIDAHADMVIGRFHETKTSFFRLNTEDFLCAHEINLALSNDSWRGRLRGTVRGLEVEDVDSIWYRRPKKVSGLQKAGGDDALKFVQREVEVVLSGLWDILDDRFWMNHPRQNSMAENKIGQLRAARRIGLETPESIITTSPEEALDFIRLHGDVIVKPLGGGFVRHGNEANLIYTNRIVEQNLLHIDSVRECPTFLQAYVPKSFELRITFISGRFFACKIDSQKSEKTKDDWRRYDFSAVAHSPYRLPEDIRDELARLMLYFGLNFGAIDMIVTPGGKYVFLEVNPNGQWGWIEHLTGMPISQCIAETLAHPPLGDT